MSALRSWLQLQFYMCILVAVGGFSYVCDVVHTVTARVGSPQDKGTRTAFMYLCDIHQGILKPTKNLKRKALMF